ncbi:a-pheromone processing metallopeptidase ste23 [Gigaspora margarita]|uniref:A-pheromone processing metallopeptidase ste23 n=1 Tax=Gigaspora margarita TaxID=4874 RepID=A0A8H3XCT8_GIGMA|nr:a-pheromone processing metallopeptidase ste23 [Gigaspora margarita]
MSISFENLPSNFSISEDGTYATLSTPLEKSENDDREYRLILLPNGLEALLISDSETDKSSAAIDVHVGQTSDPPNLQGLAHFCEHLLFMGTEKYPKENEYSEYLTKHNGSSNAYTGLDNTNYYFDVGHEHLEKALDIFAQFFICPLFNDECTDRELRAVDSEYKLNLQEDGWRQFQLEKSLSNPNNPFSQFGIGNLESLKDIPSKAGLNVREELLKFHDSYYSANLMKLVVLGREPLDTLNQWVVEKFSNVKNKSVPIPVPKDHYPITEKELGNCISLKPVKDNHSLEITFPFPDQEPLYYTKPGRYLGHLIGHEGVGSILSLLKKKGWANRLSSYRSHQYVGFEVFKISIDLTEEGLAHYEEIVEICFQYIEMLKQKDVQERIFLEVQSIASIDFRFQEKYSPAYYASELVVYMQRPYPRELILSGPHLLREYKPELIAEGLDYLTWDKCIITLSSKLLKGLDKKEKWFGVEYKMEPINEKLVKAIQNPNLHPDLNLQPPNIFIPSNFEVNKLTNITPRTRPDLIKDTMLSRLWYKKDDTFWIPKVGALFLIRSPLAHSIPLNAVKTRLYVDLVVDAFAEYAYDAEIAGISYYFYTHDEGIVVSVRGYNDKAPLLLLKVVEKMKSIQICPKRFQKIKEELKRQYDNRSLDSPNYQAMYYKRYAITQKIWSYKEKSNLLEKIQYEDVQQFYPTLFNQVLFEGFVHGNMSREEALDMIKILEDSFKPCEEILKTQLVGNRTVCIPDGKKFVYSMDVPDEKEINSAIEYYVQVGDVQDRELRAKLALIGQISDEPSFDQLRTKEQLGYLVWSMVEEGIGSMAYRIVIQSEKDPIYLENRIEDFLTKLQTIIEEMSEENYEKQITSLISKKLEKPKNLSEESYRHWYHICSGYYEFNKVEIDVSNIRNITKAELLEFYKTYIHPCSSVYKKLSIHLKSKNLALLKRFNSIDIKKLHELVSSQGLDSITEEELKGAIDILKIQSAGKKVQEIEFEIKKLLLKKVNEMNSDQELSNETEMMLVKLSKDVVNLIFDEEKDEKVEVKDKDEYKLSTDNEIIEDLFLFKRRMKLRPDAMPVLPWDSYYENL